jgi:uncharacterized membrane protein
MSDKEGQKASDNSCGVVGVVFGILSIVSLSVGGVVMGVIGLIFSMKQKNKMPNKWSKAGTILSWIGIIIGIIAVVFLFRYANDYVSQLGLEGF